MSVCPVVASACQGLRRWVGNGDAGRTQDRGSWDQTALQIERPDDISGWTTTATGTSSAALTTATVPALDLSTTGAGSTRYYQTTASFLDRTHIIAEWVVGLIVNGSSGWLLLREPKET